MKRKLVFILALISILACALSFTVSADRSASNEFGEVTTLQGMSTSLSDKASRVVLLNSDGTYTTYPTYYVSSNLTWQGTPEYNFDALNALTGESYNMYSIVRIEIIADATVFYASGGDFAGSYNLVQVCFPENTKMKELGGQIFQGTSLEAIEIPATVEILGVNLFEACASLKSVTFAPGFSMTSLPRQMFNGCSALESIRIPNSVTHLGGSLFVNCTSLKEVFLGSSVVTAESSIFAMVPQDLRIYAPDCFLSETDSIGETFFSWASHEPKRATLFWEGDYSSALAFASKSNNSSLKNAVFFEWSKSIPDSDYASRNGADTWTIVYNYSTCLAYYGSHDIPSEPTVFFEGDSFVSNCILGGKCKRDGCGEQIVHSTIDPLFSFMGLSKSTYNGAIMQSFSVNRALLTEYENLFDDISFGALVAVERNLNGILYNSATGKFAEGVASYSFSDKSYDVFEIKLSGLKNFPSTRIYICGYIIANGQIYYLHNGTSNNKPTAITYNQIGG